MAQPSEAGFGDTGERGAWRVPTTLGKEATRISAHEVPAVNGETNDLGERGHFLLHAAQMGNAFADDASESREVATGEAFPIGKVLYLKKIFGEEVEEYATTAYLTNIVDTMTYYWFKDKKKVVEPQVTRFKLIIANNLMGVPYDKIALLDGVKSTRDSVQVQISNAKTGMTKNVTPAEALKTLVDTMMPFEKTTESVDVKNLDEKTTSDVTPLMQESPAPEMISTESAGDVKRNKAEPATIDGPKVKRERFDASADFLACAIYGDEEDIAGWYERGGSMLAALEGKGLLKPQQAHIVWNHIVHDRERSEPLNHAFDRMNRRLKNTAPLEPYDGIRLQTLAQVMLSEPRGGKKVGYLDELKKRLANHDDTKDFTPSQVRIFAFGLIQQLFARDLTAE